MPALFKWTSVRETVPKNTPPIVCAVPGRDQKVLVSFVTALETHEEMKLTELLLLHPSPSDRSNTHPDRCASTQPLKLLEMPAPLKNKVGYRLKLQDIWV
jgi:hypothetical protein